MARKMEEQSVSQRALEREKNKRLGKLDAHSQPKSVKSNCSC
jgi:hypothetical protein